MSVRRTRLSVSTERRAMKDEFVTLAEMLRKLSRSKDVSTVTVRVYEENIEVGVLSSDFDGVRTESFSRQEMRSRSAKHFTSQLCFSRT